MKKFIRTWRESMKFLQEKDAWEGIVFYSEGGSYAPYLRPMIDALADRYDRPVYYLTSDESDPLLVNPPAHVRSFFIGMGSMRTYVFKEIRAKVFAMTMPDLNTFHIKRSPKVDHYTYFHHSLVSTQMVYREGAFDHFDSMMCVGPYHADEVREWEELRGLPEKEMFEHGSPPLDTLMAEVAQRPAHVIDPAKPLNVLLAPSWGPEGVMETRANEIVEVLLSAGHFVRVRPHPRTRQHAGQVLTALAAKFDSNPNFNMNEDISGHEALFQSDVMISDWSGVAMEFAFGIGRPVVFMDVPRKVNNPAYQDMKLTPLEVSYRDKVGVVVAPDALATLPAVLDDLKNNAAQNKQKVIALRDSLFHNLGTSAQAGADILVELAKRDGSSA